MRATLLTTIALVTMQFGCQRPPPASPAPAPLAGDDAQIDEAVFRHLFANNASGAQGDAGVYCLRVGRDDPGAALLARFATNRPRVAPASACREDSDGVFLRREGAGARPGLVFTVGDIDIEGARATASGAYFEGGLSAAYYEYCLRKTASGWEVTKQILIMIS